MRGAVSEGGGNASPAGKRRQVWRSLNGHEGEAGHSQGGAQATLSCFPGGQGVRSDPKSEGFEEKYLAVIDRGYPEDEQVGQRWGKIGSAVLGRRRYSFTHRTKVFAGGTIRKIHV